eukprot:2345830-Amphidinium_carterae.1
MQREAVKALDLRHGGWNALGYRYRDGLGRNGAPLSDQEMRDEIVWFARSGPTVFLRFADQMVITSKECISEFLENIAMLAGADMSAILTWPLAGGYLSAARRFTEELNSQMRLLINEAAECDETLDA